MVIFGHSCITCCRKATIPSWDSSSASCFWFRCQLLSVSVTHMWLLLILLGACVTMWRDFLLMIVHHRQPCRKLCTRNLGTKILHSFSLFGVAWFHYFYGCLERVCGIHHCQKRPVRYYFASQRFSCYIGICSSHLPYVERDWLCSIQARAMWYYFSMGDCLLLVGSLWSCNV